MNRKTATILLITLSISVIGIWTYLKTDEDFKLGRGLDSSEGRGSDVSEVQQRDTIGLATPDETQSAKGYNELADEQNRKVHTISAYNTDMPAKNKERPAKSLISNSTFDTVHLFKIWTKDPEGPHADFRLERAEFYVVDYDGVGAMPYVLDRDSLTIFYNDFVQKGKIIYVDSSVLRIHWTGSGAPTEYVEWKN